MYSYRLQFDWLAFVVTMYSYRLQFDWLAFAVTMYSYRLQFDWLAFAVTMYSYRLQFDWLFEVKTKQVLSVFLDIAQNWLVPGTDFSVVLQSD